MKISMTPNPMIRESVSCSQYDTGRKFEFELYDGDGVIDTSNVADQMAFYSRKDGTEQLLPVNDDEPETSPIKCDITYPIADEKTGQYFTYRESPTQKDGLAKIRGIKGNTLVWNQQYEDRHTGTAASEAGITRTYGNENIFILNGTSTGTATFYINSSAWPRTFYKDHKYLLGFLLLQAENNKVKMRFTQTNTDIFSGYHFITPTATVSTNGILRVEISSGATLSNYSARILIFDLTKMFGAGKEPATVDEFKALFPLSYYKYNTGSLLDFTGIKVKTTGKNLCQVSEVVASTSNTDLIDMGWDVSKTVTISFTLNGKYTGGNATAIFNYQEGNGTNHYQTTGNIKKVSDNTNITSNTVYSNERVYISYTGNFRKIQMYFRSNSYATWDATASDIQIEFGSSATSYEPYTSNETELPTDTFFPTGMKSAGSVYDELNETDYITRVGSIDLGDLSWTATTNNRYITTGIASLIKAPVNNQTVANIVCGKYAAVTYSDIVDNSALGIAVNANTGNVGNICIRDTGTYADAAAFKTAMSGVRLYYELATPLENYGVVDLGSLTWSYNSTDTVFSSTDLQGLVKNPATTSEQANLVCSLYKTIARATQYNNNVDMSVALGTTGSVFIKNSSYTSDSTFKTAMSGVYLLYEKAESHQLESASIVTADGEKPLSPEDGKLVCLIDENITSNPGMYEAKISYSKDGKKNYSNKFQIYVERSPE